MKEMQTAAKPRLTAQDYLDLERKAEMRSEFWDGEMFAMAGGTRRHSCIKVNLIRALAQQLRRTTCQVFDSDMRVKIDATELYTYPDALVACGHLRFEDEKEDTLLNPKIIFEVLSDSTTARDRGKKFWHYRRLESLQDYVLVSQEARLFEHFTLQANGTWVLDIVEGPKGVLHLKSIKCKVPLAEVYENTGLPPAPRRRTVQPKPSTKRLHKR